MGSWCGHLHERVEFVAQEALCVQSRAYVSEESEEQPLLLDGICRVPARFIFCGWRGACVCVLQSQSIII